MVGERADQRRAASTRRTCPATILEHDLGFGNETTCSSLSGAIWRWTCIATRESLLAGSIVAGRVVDGDPALPTPVYHMAPWRGATSRSAGDLREGERLHCCNGRANYDPAVFADPHRSDISAR